MRAVQYITITALSQGLIPSPTASAQGLSSYAGAGAEFGLRERRETQSAPVVGAFLDWGVDNNTLLRGSLGRSADDWTVAVALLYVFQETSPYVRPYVGAGSAKDPQKGPFRPDLRLGIALVGFGASSLLLETRWLQTATDVTVGWTGPF